MRKGRMIGRLSLWLGLLCLLVAPLPAEGESPLQPRGFDGDTYADLAVGVPGEEVLGASGTTMVEDAGVIHVLSGNSLGVAPKDDEVWHQNRGRPGIAGEADPQDRFGAALATGDLNGDRKADLIVGVPGDEVEGVRAGAVNVLYGSATGLTDTGNQIWHQGSAGVHGAPEEEDDFGSALAVGDFDGDGYDDLAVGVPSECTDPEGQVWDAGAVNVLYGSAGGLTITGNKVWHQDLPGMEGWGSERFDRFGSALAAGDFDGDGYDDLAVGVPGETFGDQDGAGGILDVGVVNVLYGSGDGLTVSGTQIWHQDVRGVGSSSEWGDQFGYALAVGNFDGDDYDDLAVGVPYEDVEEVEDGGAVQVLYGSAGGLTARGEEPWHQDRVGVDDRVEASDRFGYALAAGNFDGDGYDDLAIGVPYETVEDETYGDVSSAGAVNVLYGSSGGLTGTGEPIWHQGQPDLAGAPEADDCFGHSLAAGDLNGDGRDDLAVGVPCEDIGTIKDAGAVNILYGSSTGLKATGGPVWHQDQPGVEGKPGQYDRFGDSLAIAGWYGEVPSAPGGVEASDGTYPDKVRVSWNVVPGATSYNVWWSDSAAGMRWFLGSTTSTSYDHTYSSPGPGVLQYYWVTTCIGTRCSDFGDGDSGYRALMPPPMVEASDGTYPDKVRVTWVVVIGATSYNVWWSDSVAGMMWFLGSTSGTTYDHTYSSPGPGVLQYYWVTACNGPRCSAFSDGDSGYRGCDPPAAPAGLQATDDRLPDRVALSWSAVAGADSYEVYRAASPEGARFWLGEVTATAYDDTSAVPGTPYHYWVTACDSCGCGDYSNSDTGSRSGTCTDPPSPPGNVQASDGTYAEKVQVSWDPVAGAENYEIFRAGSANGVRRLLGFATGKSYGDTTAIPGPTYYYWVRTCTHACGCGDLGSHDTGYRPAVSAERIYLPLLVR